MMIKGGGENRVRIYRNRSRVPWSGAEHERDVSLISDQILDGGKPVGVSAATEEVGAAARANSGGRRGAVGMVATMSELGSCKVMV